MNFNIKSPGDVIGKGCRLKWSSGFSSEWNGNFTRAQLYVGTECVRCMKRFTPFLNGPLEHSATVTNGGAEIRQSVPYARYQYYGKVMTDEKGRTYVGRGETKNVVTNRPLVYNKHEHAEAGSLWFERMKAKYKDQILAGAQRIANGGTI